MKQLLISLMLGSFLLSPSAVFAQVDQNLEVDPGNGGVGGTATDTTGGFDWRWLIPIVGIPLLLYALTQMGTSDRERTTTYRDDTLAGTKGGSVKRRRIEDDDDTAV